VPYGDPSPTQSFKNVFEEGEYGIGWLVNSLTLGCDCLGHIHYFDGVVNDQQGGAVTIPNAVCMHEEDYGIGWKHTDVRTGDAVVRRSRRLAVSSISTFDNYDYGFYWYLYLDGTVEFEVKLTGIISAAATAPGLPLRHGVLVAPGVYCPHHQHYFSVRLDTAIDGDTNTVVEVDTVPSGLAHDPHAWEVARTPLRRESEARRRVDALHSRVWRIENPHRRGPTGTPVAYTLLPGTVAVPPFPEDSPFGRRGRFAFHQLWVTAYHPRERYAAGDYPMQQAEPGGLPSYTEADRNLEATDIVLWYTVGVNHVVRPEDWPVMPVEHAGFRLVPSGFFEGNPALDVPEADGGHC
jgi:primary-amine oxidase